MSRILIATDAWHPQMNGVVRTLDTTTRTLRDWGHTVELVEPSAYPSAPVPFYPEIRVCLRGPAAFIPASSASPPTTSTLPRRGPWSCWFARSAGAGGG